MSTKIRHLVAGMFATQCCGRDYIGRPSSPWLDCTIETMTRVCYSCTKVLPTDYPDLTRCLVCKAYMCDHVKPCEYLEDMKDNLVDERYHFDDAEMRKQLDRIIRAAQVQALRDLLTWTNAWECPTGDKKCMLIRAGIRGVGKQIRERIGKLLGV